jgi:diguanylate cyclase (GGDEF)-like protein
VRRAVFLSVGGLAVFLSYLAVMTGVAPDANLGSVSIAAVAFPGLVSGFVLVAYAAWESRNLRRAAIIADELNTQLVRKEIELGRLSALDELTRLYSRREFDNILRAEFERRRRYGRDLSLLLLDADHVAEFHDGSTSKTYLLQEVATIFRQVLRANDVGGRVTPERLGLVLPETDEIRAQLVADKIRAAVGRHEFIGMLADGGTRVTVAAGIAMASDDFDSAEEFFAAAEAALGEAIVAGYNQVRVYRRVEIKPESSGPFSLAS